MSAAHHRSYAEQSAHYFARPHEGVPSAPIETPAAWRGGALAESAWRTQLSPAQIAGFERALEAALARNVPLQALARDDFPLPPALAADLARWREALRDGLGVVVLSGLPVARWGEAAASVFFWGFGLWLGEPGAQNPQGDLLGHVTDTGDDRANPLVRLYRTRAHIAHHCDAADVVGLLCLHAARRGGLSRLASSVTVFNEVLRRRPDLAPRLFAPFALDLRTEQTAGARGWTSIAPCRFANGRLRTFYHADYFRSAPRHPDAPPLAGDDLALLDLYEAIANEPDVRLDMALAPGDVQLVSNHTVIHARTAYEDEAAAAAGAPAKRHLLRLWLSLD